MIKYAVLIFALVAMGQCQRPPYAGSANRYPQVLPRFRDQTSTTIAPQPSGSGTDADVANRVGEESGAFAASAGAPAQGSASTGNGPTTQSAPTVPTTPRDLPVLALGDADFVDRIMTWPEDARPFWFTNRHAIDAHLHPSGNQNTAPRSGAETRSFFAG